MSRTVGLISYGAYIPKYRIRVSDIASVWGKNASDIVNGLKISEKSVPGPDEDTITISIEALRNALSRSDVDPGKLKALFIGSESHPYAVKPSSVSVAQACGMGDDYFTADLEFACKAGTAGMQIVSSFIASGKIDYGVAIGADTAQGKPGDALEYTAAAGGAAFVLGADKSQIIATLDDFDSYTTDTPDFWRGKHDKYPSHAERFTGAPAYFKHVIGATKRFLSKCNLEPRDFSKAVFHMPNGKFPRKAAKILGFSNEQIADGLVVDFIGNTYSGSSLLGFARALDTSRPGDRILVTSYGSGSGSDVFAFTVTENILKLKQGVTVNDLISKKKYVNYGQYARLAHKID